MSCVWCAEWIYDGQETGCYPSGVFHKGCLEDFYKSWEQEEHGK